MKDIKKLFDNEYIKDYIDLASDTISSLEVTGCIFKTTDYDKFKFLVGNREVNKHNVNKIKESIKAIGYKQSQPVIVDIDFRIIDGQHRFTACQELNEPVYFTFEICEESSIELTQKLNIDQKNWGVLDFIKSYAKRGYQDYIDFMDFMDERGITHDALLILTYGHRTATINAAIKEGKLVFGEDEMTMAKYYYDKIIEIQDAIPTTLDIDKKINKNIMNTKTCQALRRIIKCDRYDQKRMLSQIATGYRSIDFRSVSSCGESLVSLYNIRLKKSNRLPAYDSLNK